MAVTAKKKAKPTEPEIERKNPDVDLDELAATILRLDENELETLLWLLMPDVVEELKRRAKEAEEHPERLLSYEQVFGETVEGVLRRINKRRRKRPKKAAASRAK